MNEPSEMHKKMKSRNYVLAGVLIGFVVLMAVVTYVKLKAMT